MKPAIRDARAADLEAINAIYNHYVPISTCTYQEQPETIEARQAWFAAHGPRHPILVAEDGAEIVGWGSLSPFRGRSGYRESVEDSVYIRNDRHGRGIGSLLLATLIERARSFGYHTIVGGCDAEQAASIALHERHGFVRVAHFREVGLKFGRRLDVVFLQLMLAQERQ
jgi:L-amino acid N-acyltransferase